MNRLFIAIIALWGLGSPAVAACDLSSCALPEDQHHSSAFKGLPEDEWAWIDHDVTVAKAALRRGESSRALQIVAGLDHAVRLRQDAMIEGRGKRRVAALHRTLRKLAVEAGGSPLAELEARGGGDRGSEGPTARDEGETGREARGEREADRARHEADRPADRRERETPDRAPGGGRSPW
jgi:hypothetical protein